MILYLFKKNHINIHVYIYIHVHIFYIRSNITRLQRHILEGTSISFTCTNCCEISWKKKASVPAGFQRFFHPTHRTRSPTTGFVELHHEPPRLWPGPCHPTSHRQILRPPGSPIPIRVHKPQKGHVDWPKPIRATNKQATSTSMITNYTRLYTVTTPPFAFWFKNKRQPHKPRITCSSCATKKIGLSNRVWPMFSSFLRWLFRCNCPSLWRFAGATSCPPCLPWLRQGRPGHFGFTDSSWWLVNQFHMICQFGDLVICFENQLLCLWGSFCLCGIFLGKIAGWPSKQCGFAWAKRLRLRNRGETDNWIVHVRVGAWVVSCHQIGMGK